MITSFFIYLLQVSICVILFYGFYHLFLRKENFFQLNRIYLVGTAFLSLTIPYFQISLNNVSPETEVIYLVFDHYIVEGMTSATAHTSIDWWNAKNILLGIYGIGVLFFLMKILIGIFYVFQLKSKSSVQKKDGYYLVRTNTPHPVFSFLNMIFWNKELEYSEKEAEQILLHEQVHVNQKHSLDILFLEAMHALLWFNPCLFFYKKSLRDTHEFIADYQLYKKYRFEIQYVDLLMKEAKSQRGDSFLVVHTFFNNQLEKRLVMIKNSNKHSNKTKLLGSLPILAALIFTFSIEPNANAQTTVQDKSKAPKERVESTKKFQDAFSELYTKPDGTKLTDEEIKNFILAKNKAVGHHFPREGIFLCTEDLIENCRKSAVPNLPEMKSGFRIVLEADGKLMVMAGKTFQKSLAIKSFDALVYKPKNKSGAMVDYIMQVTAGIKGNQLNEPAMKFIRSIEKQYKDHAHIFLKNLVVVNDGKEYLIKSDYKLSLDAIL